MFAFQDEGGANPGDPVTGDAANITANISIDGAAVAAVADTNPTEIERGYYVFSLTTSETDGDVLLLSPSSSTANVQVIGVPATVWPRQGGDTVVVAADGDYVKGNTADIVMIMLDSNGDEVADPSFSAGDVQILSGASYVNTTNLPTVITGTGRTTLTLTTSETDADRISLRYVSGTDAWDPIYVELRAENTNVAATINASTVPTYISPTSKRQYTDGTIRAFLKEDLTGTDVYWISPVDVNGLPIDLTSTTLEFVVDDKNSPTDVIVIADGSLTKEATRIGIPIDSTNITNVERDTRYALRDNTTRKVYAKGRLTVEYAPEQD